MKKLVCLICIAALLTGCASMSDSGQTKAQGTGIGAGIGAALGAGIGYLAGGKKGALIGAAAGAGAGAIGGYLYGSHVANKKAEYASQEEYLNACINSTRQVNTDTRQYNASLKGEIQNLDQEVTRLIALYNNKKIKRTTLQKEKNKVAAKLADANKKLKRAKDEVAIQREVMKKEQGKSQAELAKLNTEVNNLQKSVSDLEQNTETLASINNRIRL